MNTKASLGRSLDYLGRALIPGAVGVVLGFYLADRGTAWLPTLVRTT